MAKHASGETGRRRDDDYSLPEDGRGIRLMIFFSAMMTFFSLYWLFTCTVATTIVAVVLLSFALIFALGAYAATFDID